MSDVQFTNLVEMQEVSCAEFSSNPLFGTRSGSGWTWMTYAEFAKKVDAFRAALAAIGVSEGDHVAAISNNRVEWAIGAYATYGLGAHYVPMYEAQLPKDWTYILEDSAAVALLVATPGIYGQVKDWPGKVGKLKDVICFDGPASEPHSFAAHLEKGEANPVPSVKPAPEHTAGLIYTSGTTGVPKGVVLSHGNIVSNINAVHAVFPMTSEDRSLSFLPWAHSFGQTVELHVLLSMGASMGINDDIARLVDNLGEVRPTLLFAVPRIFNRIYDGLKKRMAAESPVKRFLFEQAMATAKRKRELEDVGESSWLVNFMHSKFDKLIFQKVRERFGGRLRYAFSGGAALSKEVGQFIDDVGILVFEGYGLTETSPIATANRPGARRIGTIGKPIPGVSIHICDEDGKELPPGTDGEIVIVGPNVMQGYYNKPEATAEVIFDLDGKRAFRSGDMGRIEPDGFVRITGRFKEQYKLENGKYVVPSPLEELLQLSGFVLQAFVWGDNRPYNVCLVVPDQVAVEKWAKEQGITYGSVDELYANDKVHARIGQELATYGADFKAYERPKAWALIKEEFTTDNDMLTPKMSVKRRNVVKRYQSELDALYT